MKIDQHRRMLISKPGFNLTTRKHVIQPYIYMFDILNLKQYTAFLFNLQITIYNLKVYM